MARRYKTIRARDAKRNIGRELLQAIGDVKAGKGTKYQVAPNPSDLATREGFGLLGGGSRSLRTK